MSPHTLRATSYCFIKSAVKHEYRCTGSITDSTVIPLILSDRETINSDSLTPCPDVSPFRSILSPYFSEHSKQLGGGGGVDFLVSPVVKNLPSSPAPKESAFQCGGWRFDPWSGNLDPTCFWETKPACGNEKACVPQQRPRADIFLIN